MAENTSKVDWNAVRETAHDCLNATWDLIYHEGCIQDSVYDEQRAKAHLKAIEGAILAFKHASIVLIPSFGRASTASKRHSPIFDSIALATAFERSRPDFSYKSVLCATAHEAAYELLRRGVLRIEDSIHALGSVGTKALGELTGPELRKVLTVVATDSCVSTLIDATGVNQLRSWVDREWAAVVVHRRNAGISAADDRLGGVSLHDAMLFLDGSGDSDAASDEVKHFSKSNYEKPSRIGKCPQDGRRYLHLVGEVVRCLTIFYGLNDTEVSNLEKHLQTKARMPARK